MNNTQHTLTTDLAHLTQINDLLHDFNTVADQRDELLAALRQIATADYTRIDVATLGNIARAAIAKAEGRS